ncbi:hypothetical protein [Cellulophaga sp. BC115SP]|uniref:hypothetical protein n=1 Tax=Cellulophaga sp. BC115SP TaxID=2683263 RepID=UPI0014127589|nr:hypothetical protein [Cellulophaga sp. BC115SP]NBB31983.1 hypothetical protein [Cellulophaga sp. BC115SP]
MEYILLFWEYFTVKGWKSNLFSSIIYTIVSVLIYVYADTCSYAQSAASFLNTIITVLGIMIGFTISTFALLLTVNSPKVEEAKKDIFKETRNRKISTYDTILIPLAFVVVFQGSLLFVDFLFPIFYSLNSEKGKVFFSVSVSLTIYVVNVLMKAILHFYFIITKQ